MNLGNVRKGLLYRQVKAFVPRDYVRLAKLFLNCRRHRDLSRLLNELRVERMLAQAAAAERPQLHAARQLNGPTYASLTEPLVSVTIATYNRSEMLAERSIRSVLTQTYPNFEIVVVGDGCTDNTADTLRRFQDDRIRFYNLPKRGQYPPDPVKQWMVAGSVPLNKALELARGAWIAHLDDDEIFEPDHIEVLLQHAGTLDLEFVYSRTYAETGPGAWKLMQPNLAIGVLPHSSILFRSYLRLFRLDPNSWRLNMAVDQHLWLRMLRAGVRMGYFDRRVTTAPLRPGTTSWGRRAEDREGYLEA
jgi:glycosyltransferase involved in cell wall biosynthesis